MKKGNLFFCKIQLILYLFLHFYFLQRAFFCTFLILTTKSCQYWQILVIVLFAISAFHNQSKLRKCDKLVII